MPTIKPPNTVAIENYSFIAPTSSGKRDVGYGQNIAVNDSYMAVGAIRYDQGGKPNSGVVYVYPLDEAGIPMSSEAIEIVPSSSRSGDLFGDPVRLIGSNLITASITKGGGAVYIYDLSTSPPTEMIITEVSSTPGDLYGSGMDMADDGSHLFIGACKSDQYALDAGIVYCYRINENGSYEHYATIRPPTAGKEAGFGRYIEATDTQILIGSQNSNVVHVYDIHTLAHIDSIWLGPHGDINGFGVPIDVYEDIAVIGARDSFGGIGCAVVFQINPEGKWIYQGIVYDQSLSSRGLGITVSVMDGLIATAPKESIINGNVNQGSVVFYEYTRESEGITLDYIGTFSPDSSETGDFFGKRITLENGLLYATSLYDDNLNGTDAGGVYIIPLNEFS